MVRGGSGASASYMCLINVYMGLTDALTVGHYPDMTMKINTESPRLAVTPGEWYANDLHATTSTGFPRRDVIPHMIGAVKLDCRTVQVLPRLIPPRLTVAPLNSMN